MRKIVYLLIFILFFGLGALNVQADVFQIEEAILNEDFELAQFLAQEILNDEDASLSDQHQAEYYLALSALRLNDYKESIRRFEKLLKEKLSQDVQDKSFLGLFENYYLQRNYKKARKIAKKMIKKSRSSSFKSLMYLKLARAHLKLAKWKKAKANLKKIVEDYPDSFESPTARQLLDEDHYFAVQVGAFLDRQRALDLVEDLKNKAEYAYIVETVDRKNQTFYRVRVGQMARLKDAEELKINLSQEGYPALIYP